MSRSMIKQQNSGATAHVVLYTPRQSTNCTQEFSPGIVHMPKTCNLIVFRQYSDITVSNTIVFQVTASGGHTSCRACVSI